MGMNCLKILLIIPVMWRNVYDDINLSILIRIMYITFIVMFIIIIIIIIICCYCNMNNNNNNNNTVMTCVVRATDYRKMPNIDLFCKC
jgi:hypothetical protein